LYTHLSLGHLRGSGTNFKRSIELRDRRIRARTLKLNGVKVKSEFEYDSLLEIRDMLPEGATIEYEVDKLPYIIEHNYNPDHTITFKSGRKLYIEMKGNGRSFDQHARSKMIAVKAQHPDKDIRIIFYANGVISGTKKRKRGGYFRQSEWADRNGFKYSIKNIDPSWLLEDEEISQEGELTVEQNTPDYS